MQGSFSHFTQQPQYIPWHLQYALDNVPRRGTMQCQELWRMATDTINPPDEGGMGGVPNTL